MTLGVEDNMLLVTVVGVGLLILANNLTGFTAAGGSGNANEMFPTRASSSVVLVLSSVSVLSSSLLSPSVSSEAVEETETDTIGAFLTAKATRRSSREVAAP